VSLRRRRAAAAAAALDRLTAEAQELGAYDGTTEAEVAAGGEAGGGIGVAPSDPADEDHWDWTPGLSEQSEAELAGESGDPAAELEEASADGEVGAFDEVIED